MKLDVVIARMEQLGWTWDPAERVFWRVHDLRLSVEIAVRHITALDREARQRAPFDLSA